VTSFGEPLLVRDDVGHKRMALRPLQQQGRLAQRGCGVRQREGLGVAGYAGGFRDEDLADAGCADGADGERGASAQGMEPAHTQILHQNIGGRRVVANTIRRRIDEVAQYDFYEIPDGFMKKRVMKNGVVDEHPVLFPNVLRHYSEPQIRVPVDDTHTQVVIVDFYPSEDGLDIDEEHPEFEYVVPFKEPPDALHPFTTFTMRIDLKAHNAQPEDHMAWETQGPIADRTKEHLSYSDKGIALFRNVLRENIALVQAGEDPKGVQRDPNHAIIDTNLDESIRICGTQYDAAPERVATPAGVAGPFQWGEAQ
jgi:hypothetical protein